MVQNDGSIIENHVEEVVNLQINVEGVGFSLDDRRRERERLRIMELKEWGEGLLLCVRLDGLVRKTTR